MGTPRQLCGIDIPPSDRLEYSQRLIALIHSK